jgi:formylglycine-generating enzyme required for sulfatase activity
MLLASAAIAEPPATYKEPFSGMEFVFVKGGCFQMGDTFGDARTYRDPSREIDICFEKPIHEVCVDSFYIGKYEVTQQEWTKMIGKNPSAFVDNNNPVDYATWEDANMFAKVLTNKGGRKYRLPTEAEWEYAARSGGQQDRYAGTSNSDDLGSYAWILSNADDTTHPVGQKKPNKLGIYDMSGNVGEWCSDWYGQEYYVKSPRVNPGGPDDGEYKVLRGGSYARDPSGVRAAGRYIDYRSGHAGKTGLRLVSPVQDTE